MFRILLLLPLLLFAKTKICLNMIVKDEADIIQRCLDSVIPYIDYWVIVDTGSKDGTQKIIKNHLKGIPGKLYERKWKNWGASRTEARELAKGHGEYLLFMDADDVLEVEDPHIFDDLKADMYLMWRGPKGFTYLKPQIAKDSLDWKWIGVTHEYLDCKIPYSSEVMQKVRYISLDDGATHKDLKTKFRKNIDLLEQGLKDEPENARYMFYLAESYRDAGEPAKALEWYQKRIQMGGWEEEIFCAMLQSAHMLKEMKLPQKVVSQAYLAAQNYRHHRPEPIYYLVEYLLSDRNYKDAYEILKIRNVIEKPREKDSLFNEDWIEDYGFDFQLSICAYYVDRYQEALDTCERLLNNSNLPECWKVRTIANREFPIAKLNTIRNELDTRFQPHPGWHRATPAIRMSGSTVD